MATFQSRELYDGTTAWPLGINSGVPPILLSRLQASFATNTTFRGSYATDRPPINKLQIAWPDPLVQAAVEQGLWQGGGFYKPDFGASSLFASISGRLFQFQLTGDVVTVVERTIPGDQNPATTTQVWMWQAENFLIINDGISLPIFFDGSTTRRSDGFSRDLELTAADWVIPALGSPVTITLTTPYTGPFNRMIYVDGIFYQPVENANASYNVTLTNLTATPGGTIAAGTEAIVQPVRLGRMESAISINIASGSVPVGGTIQQIDISYPYTGGTGVDLLINGKIWRIAAVLNGGLRLSIQNRFTISAPGYQAPVGTLVQFASSPSPNVSLGTVVTPFVIPAQDGTVAVELSQAYTGADDASVWIDDQQYSIEAVPPGSPGTTLTIINMDDTAVGQTRGPTGTAGLGQLSTVDELPPGRMGAYGMGRNVMSLVDGQSYVISDIVGGGSGTQANSFRDSVLKITENTYELGGGVFRIPGSAGDIRAIIFPAVLDGSFGQGPCQILTPERCFSVNVPVDRTDWQTVTNPIQSQSLISNGGQGQNSTITVDGDIQFRSVDGWRSLVFGRRQFTDPGGNSPMSHEVDRIIQNDSIELLPYGSAVYFDNRVLWTASPQESAQGVIHPALVAQNLESLASINDKNAPFYDGLWTGLNVLQLIAGKSLGKDRCFAFGLNVPNSKIELYEFLPTGEEHFDNGYIPITWWTEGPALFQEDPKNRSYKRIEDGEIQIDDADGRVDFAVYYKPDQWPCWVLWRRFPICATQGDGLKPGFFPRMGLGQPSPEDCDSFTNRPLREGYTFQVKVEVTGHCRGLAINLRTSTQPEPKMAPLVPPDCATVECKELECSNPVDFEVYSLQSGLIFTSGVLSAVASCPEGFTCAPGVSPHTFTYEEDRWMVPVPPVILVNGGQIRLDGCQSAIVRTLTPGMSEEAIDAIVQEMFAEVAQQQAECDMPTIPGVTPDPEVPDFHLTELTPSMTCVGAAYSGSISSTESAIFSVIGTLPAGLTLAPLATSTTTATLSGTPTTLGTTVFVIKAEYEDTELGHQETFKQVTFAVVGISTASPLTGGSEGAAYSQTIQTSGMSGTITWAVIGTIPPGLTFDTATGILSGTPDAGSAGTYNFVITASND